jgi:hypothetical protein
MADVRTISARIGRGRTGLELASIGTVPASCMDCSKVDTVLKIDTKVVLG